jgi:hypothetical protein
VGVEKVSESKPTDDASKFSKTLSKLQVARTCRTSLGEICLLPERQPVQTRHDLDTGFSTEREKS